MTEWWILWYSFTTDWRVSLHFFVTDGRISQYSSATNWQNLESFLTTDWRSEIFFPSCRIDEILDFCKRPTEESRIKFRGLIDKFRFIFSRQLLYNLLRLIDKNCNCSHAWLVKLAIFINSRLTTFTIFIRLAVSDSICTHGWCTIENLRHIEKTFVCEKFILCIFWPRSTIAEYKVCRSLCKYFSVCICVSDRFMSITMFRFFKSLHLQLE